MSPENGTGDSNYDKLCLLSKPTPRSAIAQR